MLGVFKVMLGVFQNVKGRLGAFQEMGSNVGLSGSTARWLGASLV